LILKKQGNVTIRVDPCRDSTWATDDTSSNTVCAGTTGAGAGYRRHLLRAQNKLPNAIVASVCNIQIVARECQVVWVPEHGTCADAVGKAN
jgi:hypothetical protein